MGVLVSAPRFVAPFTPITDSFDRADSTTTMGNTDTGQTWVPNAGTWGITSNTAYLQAGSGQNTTVVDSGVSDCTVGFTISTYAANLGFCLRSQNDSNHLLVTFGGGIALEVYTKIANSFTVIASNSTTVTSGDAVSVVLSGTSIVVKKNGTTVLSTTSSSFQTETKHGLRNFGATAARFNDFSVTVP